MATLGDAAAAARLATKFLSEDGLVVLTGAAAAEQGTPGMIAYGISKAATHHIVRSLAYVAAGSTPLMHELMNAPLCGLDACI